MPSAELHDLTLAEAARLISVRKLSPVEYTESLLARTEALEPQLNAFITRTPDVAMAAARTAEAEIMHGNLRGPLHGIPFALKDIYDTAGILTSGHSRTCIDRVPDKDATTVARLKAAGGRADGQARDARVRARRSVVRPAVAAGAQSLEHSALHRRLVVGLGRRTSLPAWCRRASAPIPAARSAARLACAVSPD